MYIRSYDIHHSDMTWRSLLVGQGTLHVPNLQYGSVQLQWVKCVVVLLLQKDELKREIVTLRKEIKEIRLLVFERDTKHGTRDTTHETSTTALATLSSTVR